MRDKTGPVLSLPPDVVVEATSAQGAVATYTATAEDAVSGPVQVSLSPQSGSTFALGTTNVNATATDQSGNTSTGSFKVIVRDTTAPVITAPADLVIEATSAAGAAASYAASADDLVDGNVAVGYSVAPGSTFALGTTTVTVTATDAAGNNASATFKVTVRDTTAPSVSCPAEIVVAAAPGASTAAVSFNVTANDTASAVNVTSSVPSGFAFPLGTTTVTATATDAAGNTSSCTFTVTVKSQTTTGVLAASVQYSDAVTLQATVGAAAVPGQTLTGTVQFFVNGSSVGQSALTNGVATLALAANMPAGSYSVTAQFASTNPFYVGSAGGPAALTINRENAATAYNGDTVLLTGGPEVNTATVRLSARLTQEADGQAGDITKATVAFELFKSGNQTSTPDQTVGGVAVDANGDASATVNGLSAGGYTVKVTVEGANLYWTAQPVGTGALSVAIPSKDTHSHGSGWVADATSANGRASFEFNVKSDKKEKDGPVKGNSTFTFRGADGFDYVVEGTTWQDGYLQFAAAPGVTPAVYTRSEFKGRCNVQKVNPATGQKVAAFSNYTFEVFTSDGDLLDPRQADAYAFIVRDGSGQVWHQVGSRNALVTLGGGNVTNKTR